MTRYPASLTDDRTGFLVASSRDPRQVEDHEFIITDKRILSTRRSAHPRSYDHGVDARNAVSAPIIVVSPGYAIAC